ncbi:MAG: DsbE family thiol:disulfide interchange protein [Gammaproteobacteria bacterium]
MKSSYIPLGIFILLAVLLGVGLTLNPREVPSPLIDKPAPDFALPDLNDPKKIITASAMQGQVWFLNVWGSWCPECWREHGYLEELTKESGIPIVGLNWRDDKADALNMLQRAGNPYIAIPFDPEGRVAIDWGVYGAPETFVIDKQGMIRFKHVGSVTPELWNETLKPLVAKLKAS